MCKENEKKILYNKHNKLFQRLEETPYDDFPQSYQARASILKAVGTKESIENCGDFSDADKINESYHDDIVEIVIAYPPSEDYFGIIEITGEILTLDKLSEILAFIKDQFKDSEEVTDFEVMLHDYYSPW